MPIGRHSFIRQSKLSDVAGRIDYISNPKRQEHLYATYQTEGATPEFWKTLQEKISWILRREERQGNVSKGVSLLLHFPKVLFSTGQVMW